jgi:hypothetical protein
MADSLHFFTHVMLFGDYAKQLWKIDISDDASSV